MLRITGHFLKLTPVFSMGETLKALFTCFRTNQAGERQGMESDKDRAIPNSNGDDESTKNFKTPEEVCSVKLL